ncbi:multi-sensor signal transduction multi-kinase [Paraburkholderia atlantica]|uniref:histidine kinase n=1 Tax=Paraburkholderia atlantica TaxID=2654982 RepID=D5WFG3_PARAM|nr:AAA family ATPase [Paraburkholderia atlantica]ADG19317.1 multi-sensor signal transduction multi-kinase [Paraburkholderia atlantica]
MNRPTTLPSSITEAAASPAVHFTQISIADIVHEDADVTYCRASATDQDGTRRCLLVARPTSAAPDIATFERLSNEYRLRDKLDETWAIRPLELQRQNDRPSLVLDNNGAEPLERLLTGALPISHFLTLAISAATAVARMHHCGIVHKDLKPAHLYVDKVNARIRLTGFGIASEIAPHQGPAAPPDVIAGTMAYMAPEQTGRLRRSIDARSDLYSLGVVFYRMLTGTLPFSANTPMEWIHSHTSRKPVPPHVRSPSVPVQLSSIVIKLLEKGPEERYQSAAGLECDLRLCMKEWSAHGDIRPFNAGEADLPDRFAGPARLYGRERELARLVSAFERVLLCGCAEVVLVSGYSGVGKSSVVWELPRSLVVSQRTFAAGKCDQHNSDVPYAALRLALKDLVKQLLTRQEDEVSHWCNAIREALGPNGKLVTDLVPELALLIGEQPAAPELPLQQAQSRFQLVLRRFINAFARENTPLILFIDDLQWADAATLDLLGGIAGQSDMGHLLLIGAYRDNEVDESHPLAQKIAATRAIGADIEEVKLAPLEPGQVVSLVGDVLRSNDELVEPLANIIHTKTAGNPFFVIQFLHTLADEQLIVKDNAAGRWSWDIQPIQSAGYTDNVADLMSARLQRLPRDCLDILRDLACLGNTATAHSLAIVRQATEDAIHLSLRSAVQQELVERIGNAYRFSHDRVQEAAYCLTPDCARTETHLTLARRLSSHLSDENDDGLFEIASQFNRALSGVTSNEEREAVAEINLRAGIRAKRTAAYDAALRYLNAGAALFAHGQTERQSDIHFRFELEIAECEFLTGKLSDAERRLTELSTKAMSLPDQGRVTVSRMDVCTTLDQNDRVVSIALEFLRNAGISCSAHPADDEVKQEYEELRRRMAGLSVTDIVKLPPMTDPTTLMTVEVLTRLLSAACFTDFNLNSFITCKAINLSLANGNCEASCVAYGTLSRIAGPRFGDFEIGVRLSQAGYRIAELNAHHRFHASTCLVFAAFTLNWIEHVRLSEPLFRRTFASANQAGDLLYASFSRNHLNTNLLFSGEALQNVQSHAEDGLIFAEKAQYALVVDIVSTQLAFIRSMRGQTRRLGSFDHEHFEEQAFESRLAQNPGLAIAECWYWTRKMQARYLAGDYETAVIALSKARSLLWTSSMFIEEAEFHFYAALTLAARAEHVSVDERDEHLKRIAYHHTLLKCWASNWPKNFEDRAALVNAEVARLEGAIIEAEQSYERAIRSARGSDFPHQEAIASELAARFYRARGFEIISDAYLRNARYCYLRWGATGKVQQFDKTYPHLAAGERRSLARDTIKSQAGDLDFGLLIEVSQRISSEIVLENVIDTFMKAVLTHAGADRGVLILTLPPGGPRIEAEATVRQDTVIVEQESVAVDERRLAMKIVNYVLRTREIAIVSDSAADPVLGADPYLAAHSVRATLCMPLLRQGQLAGALYLENRLAAGAFVDSRVAALNVLASQVTIALENARLYRELSDREARIRRLVDANIIGISIFSLDGTLLDANAAFLELVGYSREELQRGELNWKVLTPVEWLERDLTVHEPILRKDGVLPPLEKEYFRKNGSRVPVLVGAAMFPPLHEEGVAFVLDLGASKLAEAEARESEIRFREVQRELAHANRLSTIGQLTATISHEVKQPIAAMAANGDAALRWLSAAPANVDRARDALNLIVRDAMRAGDIIDRIRNLVRKTPAREETVDINSAINEVLFITRRDSEKNGVAIKTKLAAPAPFVSGDRVQLQQVVLNLIVNAIEAMSAVNEGRRTLDIETSVIDGGDVQIQVSDSGPGLPAAHVDRLFEPFFTTKETGMGIGLSVAHSIVHAHGGSLLAVPNQICGTTFQVTLPSADN